MLKIFKITSICAAIVLCLTATGQISHAQRLTEYQNVDKAQNAQSTQSLEPQESAKPLAQASLRLCVLDNNPPYMFFDSEGNRHGFDMDLLEALNLPYTYQFMSRDMATSLVMLKNKACDMLLSSKLITPEMEERFLFSDAHLQSDLYALVLKESPLQSTQMLSSSIVGVVKGTSAEKYAFEELSGSTIIALKKGVDVFALLRKGEVEAIIGHKVNLQALVEHYDDVMMLQPALQKQYFAFVFSKENTALAEEVNAALDKIEYDETLFELYNKWFAKRILQVLNDE